MAPAGGGRPFWFLGLAARLGIRPLALASLIAAGVVGLTPFFWGSAAPIAYERRAFEPLVPYFMAFGLVATIGLFELTIRWACREFDALRDHLGGSSARIDRLRDSLAAYPRWIYWAGAAAGLAFSVTFHEVNTQRWSRFAAGDWNRYDVWVVATVCAYMVFLYQISAAVVVTARSLGRVGSTLLAVDLFEPDRGKPLALFGLALVLMFALLTTALLMGPALAGLIAFPAAVSAVIVNLVWCGICLTMCLRGFIRRMGQLKREELGRVERAILGVPDALSGSPVASRVQHLDFVELLTYRRELEDLRTWPIDAGMWGRLVLYLVLPPLSWVAAALVERGVGRITG